MKHCVTPFRLNLLESGCILQDFHIPGIVAYTVKHHHIHAAGAGANFARYILCNLLTTYSTDNPLKDR